MVKNLRVGEHCGLKKCASGTVASFRRSLGMSRGMPLFGGLFDSGVRCDQIRWAQGVLDVEVGWMCDRQWSHGPKTVENGLRLRGFKVGWIDAGPDHRNQERHHGASSQYGLPC